MPDYGSAIVNKSIRLLEKEITNVYATAQKELEEKLSNYIAKANKKNEKLYERYNRGEIDNAELRRLLGSQLQKQKWYGEMINQLSDDMVLTDRKARSIAYGYYHEAYAVNRNYGAFQVEKAAKVDTSFTLYDTRTVERLIRQNPQLLPKPKVDIPANKKWHSEKISAAMTQSILQGESIPKAAKRLQSIAQMDNRAAIRSARTGMTAAQNAGRVDSYQDAKDLGIDLKQQWLATLDRRTRDSHRHLDGEIVEVGNKFSNGCKYPADPQGPPEEVYNCRCTLVPVVDGIDQSNAPRNSKLGNMSYDEWVHEHDQKQKTTATKAQASASVQPTKTLERLKNLGVNYNDPQKYKTAPSEQDIIDQIGGGDLTTGSCASCSMAYTANKAGYDVRDFRGGTSMDIFSERRTCEELATLSGVKGQVLYGKNDIKNVHALYANMVDGKEYCLATGAHMAVIKKNGSSFYWLELQSPYNDNGWHPLDDSILKYRFDAKQRRKYEQSSMIIDCDTLGKSQQFQQLIGYFNTEPNKQKKGVRGHIR